MMTKKIFFWIMPVMMLAIMAGCASSGSAGSAAAAAPSIADEDLVPSGVWANETKTFPDTDAICEELDDGVFKHTVLGGESGQALASLRFYYKLDHYSRAIIKYRAWTEEGIRSIGLVYCQIDNLDVYYEPRDYLKITPEPKVYTIITPKYVDPDERSQWMGFQLGDEVGTVYIQPLSIEELNATTPGTTAATRVVPKPVQSEYSLAFNGNTNNALAGQPAVNKVHGKPSYETGRNADSKAIKFDGLTSYIRLDSAETPIDYNRSFTVAFWVKILSGDDVYFFSCKNYPGTNGGVDLAYYKNESGYVIRTPNGDIDVGSDWVHIAVVYDQDANIVRMYKNGEKSGDDKNTVLVDGGVSKLRTYIGSTDGWYSMYLGEFLMQDFQLRSGAMSDADIAELAK